MNLHTPRPRTGLTLVPILGLLLAGAGCKGGDDGKGGQAATSGARAQLVSMDYGRLVDVFAYRRTNPSAANRVDATKRMPVRVETEVLISPGIDSQNLADNRDANYRFLSFDGQVGHDELLILWDDTHPDEKPAFDRALAEAQVGLVRIAKAHRDQNANTKPIPVVPRNAAIQLTFDRSIGLETAYFDANPSAVQMLRVVADPNTSPPQDAYIPVNVRTLARGNILIIDPTLIGNEVGNGQPNSTGLPASADSAANLRIAMPLTGPTSKVFRVETDPAPEFSGPDSRGETALIRDFRSANPGDGRGGYLIDQEEAQILNEFTMGILEVDAATRTLLVNKRGAKIAIRARLPFVDGVKDPQSGLPLGSSNSPAAFALRLPDVVFQDVTLPSGEVVRVKAEVIENLEIESRHGATNPPPGKGTDPAGDSSSIATARLVVGTLQAFDSQGNAVSFQGSTLPFGADCGVRVHFQNTIELRAGGDVGDSARVAEFVTFDPRPPALDPKTRLPADKSKNISPFASVTVKFSEPMNLDSVKSLDNFLLATAEGQTAAVLQETKPGAHSTVLTRATDQDSDAMAIRLTAPLGLFHRKGGTPEDYYLHAFDGPAGVKDLAGNQLNLGDRSVDVPAFSMKFTLDSEAADNLVGWKIARFNSPDEDGTKEDAGASDWWGQYQIIDGQLRASPTVRFSRAADNQTLRLVVRGNRGECTENPPPTFPLYITPLMNVAGGGGILEPLNPLGSRLQMTYREDDFELSYTNPSDINIDVEQMSWAPFAGNRIVFDTFDRMSMLLSHSEYRPDIHVKNPTGTPTPPCAIFAISFASGLQDTFATNVLNGSTQVEVVRDRVYEINPNNTYLGVTGTPFIPYPKFEKSYTWRDQRLMSWNRTENAPIGMSGAHDPKATPNPKDFTASVSSPWIPEFVSFPGGYEVRNPGDFLGDEKLDHASVAAPLLMDFMVYPDDPDNGFASGANLFQIGYFGPTFPAPGHGYYNGGYMRMRVHSSGGRDNLGQPILVDPKNTPLARGGWIADPLLGVFQTPSGDDHVYWAQADFARKVSVVTFGYIDTLLPNRHDLATLPGTWPGKGNTNGLPNLNAVSANLRAYEFDVLVDPPPARQVPGTQVIVEFSGAEDFARSGAIYNPRTDDKALTRNNLLNPNYACESFRYSPGQNTGRRDMVQASAQTPYLQDVTQLRDSTGVAPRFLNWRISMVNNTAVSPAVSPQIESFGIAYRVKPKP